MKTLAELGRTLDEARRAKGLSNKDLAQRIGLTPLSVGHILKGKSAVRATNLLAMADELDLELVLIPRAVAEAVGLSPERRAGTGTDAGQPRPAHEARERPPSAYASPLERTLQRLSDAAAQHGRAAAPAKKSGPEGQGR